MMHGAQPQEERMKITRLVAHAESRPRPRPARDALQTLDTHGACRLTIETDDGVSGQSSIGFGRLAAGPAVLAHLIEAELAMTDYHGTAGLALLGIAAVDIALWDLVGRAVGQPVWRLLGARRDRMPAYAMVGWLNYDLDELKRICATAMEQGFRGVKMKVGAPTLEEDIDRIAAVRAEVGAEALVMVDANQVFSLNEAMRRGLVYQEMGCYWFEEPLRADDAGGLAELAAALTIPIASGENNYGKRQFRDLFERRSVDIVQPDLRRAGGVTECLEIGLMADAFNVPYASHGGGVHLHVLAALPNALFMESGLLPSGSSRRLIDGCYPLPEEPGFGSPE
jgi:L-alanine-DL-glutamate epimerase-like enolase superfamily enzyme